LTSAAQWKAWAEEFSVLPCIAAQPCADLPRDWRPFWQEPYSVLLESAKAGRYTIVIPRIERFCLGNATTVSEIIVSGAGRESRRKTLRESPLNVLRNRLEKSRSPSVPGTPPFCGGWIALLSYDLVREYEPVPDQSRDDLGLPLYCLALGDAGWVVDHEARRLFAFACRSNVPDPIEVQNEYARARERVHELMRQWEAWTSGEVEPLDRDAPETRPAEIPPPSLDEPGYCRAVERIQEYIRSGDSYQVNLSLRESRALGAPPEAIYESLRRMNPSPYMGLLRFPGFTVVSGSPELLVACHAGRLSARPIAGTRPRGVAEAEDEALAAELFGHPKERAEHLMLVDLIRNDLGRVSRYGTVTVTDFMVREVYSHVMHIVSHIAGELAPGLSRVDVLRAMFPGGTITGAPKVRTMQIIDELEPVRRGYYTGAMGWFGFGGDMELNIIIRTLLAHGGLAHVQAGAGIVADSVPASEYRESLSKARALWAAMEEADALDPGARRRVIS